MKFFTSIGCLLLILLILPAQSNAQLFQQAFSGTLTAGNAGGGTVVSNAEVTADAAYVDANASASQFTFLATNNALASIELKGDGVMKLARDGSGTIYIVRNTAFSGPPSAVKVSLDFTADVTTGTSTSPIQFILGDGFPNTKNEPGATSKHSRFYINTKDPTGTPGTWGVTAESGASASAYTTSQKVTWVVNNSGAVLNYSAPDGSSETVADDKFDVWVGNTKHIDDAAATTATVDLKNFEIRIGGGKGIYTIDNLLITELTTAPAVSAKTDHFRSKNSGDWNNIASWESSLNGTSWINATLTPNDTASTITIMDGDTLTVSASVKADQMTINSGGVVVVNGTPVVLTITNGEAAVDLLVNGILKVTGSPIVSPGPYSVSLSEGAAVSFGNGGIYEHNQNAGAIPDAVWQTGSTIKLTGIAGNAPANGNQNFYNIEWNSPAQSANLNLGWNRNTISGNIRILATGSSRWQMTAPATDSTVTVTILGDIIQTAGNFSSQGTSNGFSTVNIHHYGNVNVTGGNFSVARGSQNTTGFTNWYLYGANISLENTTTQNSNADGAKFIFAGTGVQNLTLNNVKFTGGFPVEINSGSVVNLGVSQVRGSGKFVVKAGASLATGHFGGLDSAVVTTGAKSLNAQANYSFNGTEAQITGSLLPASVNKMTINNNAGVTLSKDITINDTLLISAGDLSLDGKNITLGAQGVLTETAGNTVKGTSGKITVIRNIGTPSAVNVGGLGAVITANKDLGNTTIERYHSAPMQGTNQGIQRYYSITPGQNNSGLNASLKFFYDESELNGLVEAALQLSKSPSGLDNTWTAFASSVNTEQNYLELNGIADFSYWAAGSTSTPLPVELTSFTAVAEKNKVSLRWHTETEIQNQGWDVERKSQNSSWMKIGFVHGSGDKTEPSSYSYTDNVSFSGAIEYRLKQLDYDGTSTYSKVVEVNIVNTPSEFALHQNYPNPFNPETKISFELPVASFVNVSVYNSLGELVATIANGNMEAGYYSFNFEASKMNSGIYIYQLKAGKIVFTKKMMLVK